MAIVRHLYFLCLLCAAFLDKSESRRRRYRECQEERLKVRETAADVVLTGTVKRLYGSQNDVYGGEVQVKRIIKGHHIKAGESLLVEGFGNADICESQLKIRDSKIFLLSQLPTGSFRLNSSVLQINVPNIERIVALVKDEPYRRRSTIEDEPCEKKFCPFNGDCHMENSRAQCRCPTSCHQAYEPVCASDGVTYNTECQMRADSCRKQKKRIYVRHEGTCSHFAL